MTNSLAARLRLQATEMLALADLLEPQGRILRKPQPNVSASGQSLLVQKAAAIVGNVDELARRCCCSRALISHAINGRRGISVRLARLIDAATEGQVPHWKLRPDIWDEPKTVSA